MRTPLPATPNPRWTSGLRLLVEFGMVAVLALTVLVQANPATRVLERDQGFYVYIGKEIVRGKLPYADAWESKPPAIFYLNAAGIWLTRGSRWGVWVIELFALILAIYLCFEFVKRRWGIGPAVIATAAWVYGLDRAFDTGGNYTEEYPLPVHFLSIILMMELLKSPARRFHSFAVGALFAIAFLFRPNNAAPEAAVVLALVIAWISRRQFRDMLIGLALMGAGAALCFAVPVVYFASRGLLGELIDASVLYHLAYAGSSAPSWHILWNGFEILGPVVVLAALGYAFALFEAVRRPENRFLYIFLLIGWPITILATDPADKAFAHYYINWLPFVGLLSGFALWWLMQRLPRPQPQLEDRQAEWLGLVGSLVVAAAVLAFSGRAAEYGTVLHRLASRDPRLLESRTPTSIYAENHTKPGDTVLFWSTLPGENYMSDRESPTAALYYPAYYKSAISARLSDRFLRELMQNKPVLIIDMGHLRTLSLDPVERQRRIDEGLATEDLPDNIYQVFDYIDRNYHPVAVVKGKTVYRLNGTD